MMRRLIWALATCLLSTPVLYGQQAPTLEPSHPSLGGGGSPRTANPRMLLKIRKVYIERIDYSLNEKLEADMAHVSWLKVVNNEDDADAIIRGTCFDLRHLKRLHAEIYISDRVSGKSIWQDVIRVPYTPPDLSKAVDQAATEILNHLDASVRAASRR
ncbi:MAG: hypothetical protein EPN47_02060 [Acidobacteria bacterium]|nr:MAG: hypothetical protein EPN47_02060 [Acidobacteriota bacterium]